MSSQNYPTDRYQPCAIGVASPYRNSGRSRRGAIKFSRPRKWLDWVYWWAYQVERVNFEWIFFEDFDGFYGVTILNEHHKFVEYFWFVRFCLENVPYMILPQNLKIHQKHIKPLLTSSNVIPSLFILLTNSFIVQYTNYLPLYPFSLNFV